MFELLVNVFVSVIKFERLTNIFKKLHLRIIDTWDSVNRLF